MGLAVRYAAPHVGVSLDKTLVGALCNNKVEKCYVSSDYLVADCTYSISDYLASVRHYRQKGSVHCS